MGAERQSIALCRRHLECCKKLVSVNLEDTGDFAPSVETKQIWLDSGKAVELFGFCIVVIGEVES